jgi:hypothetical protein
MTDLTSVALETLRVNGFIVGDTDAMRAELVAPPPADDVDPAIRDLRELLWSSIDNVSSRDLDQIEVARAAPADRGSPGPRRRPAAPSGSGSASPTSIDS